MKLTTRLICAALLVAATSFASDTPASNDKDTIAAELNRTAARFLKSVDGLTEAQWNFKAAPDKWSIAECAEHIAASEPMIRAMIDKVVASELTAEMITAGTRHDDKMLKGMTDRSQKFKAPEPLQPTNRFKSPAAAVESFKTERAQTIALATGAPDLRTHGSKHFLFGPLDAYGWFLFVSGHSERHTMQIEEVKADPNFPK